MREVVTGDAVVVDLPVARPASRGLAFAVDVLVMGIAFTVILVVLASIGLLTSDDALAAAIVLSLFVGIFVGVPVTVETLTRGRSLGKMALGLRVVRDDGGPIRFRQALVRGLTGLIADFGLLSGFTGAIALISSLASMRGQRLGDRLAGTVVVRDRVPVAVQPALWMPPALAGWAGSLALSQLPDDLALAARQFVGRAAALDPLVRQTMGRSLAAEVAAVVSPPPPPGTPPEVFLSAVLAERSRRASARLAPAPQHLEWQRPASPPPSTSPPSFIPPQPSAPPQPDGFVLPG